MGLQDKNINIHMGSAVPSADLWQHTSGKYHAPQTDHPDAIYTLDEIATAVSSSAKTRTVQRQSFAPPIGSTKPLDPTKPTILIVDDASEVREMYARMFESAGYNVVEARDGLEGLDRASKVLPELIFTGVIMPRMDGFAMIEALQKNAELSAIPVIMSSHLGRNQDKTRARQLGVREFIVQGSIAQEEIVDRVHSILTRREHAIPIDLSKPEFQNLTKELGGVKNVQPPEGKTCVLKISLTNPSEMTFSGRIEFS